MTDVPTIVYDLALRSLDQQERELAELRSRTNTVIAAAALIASFLGAAAIRETDGLGALTILALVVLVVTGVSASTCCGHANYSSRSTPARPMRSSSATLSGSQPICSAADSRGLGGARWARLPGGGVGAVRGERRHGLGGRSVERELDDDPAELTRSLHEANRGTRAAAEMMSIITGGPR